VGLRGAAPGLELHFAYQGRTLTRGYGRGDELFDGWWPLGPDASPAAIGRVIDALRPDLVHSHNLPDSLTVAALEAVKGRIPVIHDVHDLQSLRATPYEDGFPEPADPLALERAAVEGADALLTVSRELVEVIAARHRPPPLVRTFANYALRDDLPPALPDPERPLREPPRVVYEGSLSTNGGHYDLRGIFAELVAQGARVDVHPSRPQPDYAAMAARLPGLSVHQPLEPARLLATLPRYDVGWAGFNARLNAAHLDTALPNKAYEYAACGLPVVTLGHRALVRLLGEEGFGADLGTMAGAVERMRGLDLPALRRRAAERRAELTVEANIGVVLDLYEYVLQREVVSAPR
jgi:glycosyltransferase involved in cell wall biosynthesis